MMKRFFLPKTGHAFMLLGAVLALASSAGADDIKMDWQSSGVSKTASLRGMSV